MRLNSKERRSFLAASHVLPVCLHIDPEKIDAGVVGHVRTALCGSQLIKVRVHSRSRDECERVAKRLAVEAPCEIVRRVGFVLLLCRSSAADPVSQPHAQAGQR